MRIKCGWGWCFVVSCLMVACTEKKKDFVPDEVVQMDVVGGSIGEVLDTVVYLPLELSESAALSRVHSCGLMIVCIFWQTSTIRRLRYMHTTEN